MLMEPRMLSESSCVRQRLVPRIERIVPTGLHGLDTSVLDWRLLSFAGLLSIAAIGPGSVAGHRSSPSGGRPQA